MSSLTNNLSNIFEKTNNSATKKIVEGLLNILNAGEVDDSNAKGMVMEALKGQRRKDKTVNEFFDYVQRLENLNNLGVKMCISESKKTELYKNDPNFSTMIDVYEDKLDEVPEYMLGQSFISGIKRYGWNKYLKSSIKVMESKMEKFKAYAMVAEAINNLQKEKDSYLYEDIIEKLDRSFYLPENQVRHYVYTTLNDSKDVHPQISRLIENLTLLERNREGTYSDMSKVTYVTDRHQGRVKVYERMAPAIFGEDRDIFFMNNSIYEIKDGKLSKVKNIHEDKDITPEFINLCERFSNFQMDEGKLILEDRDHTVGISINEAKKFDVSVDMKTKDGEPETEIVTVEADDEESAINQAEEEVKKKYPDVKIEGGSATIVEEDDMKIEVDGEPQDGAYEEIMGELNTMGINPDMISLVQDMVDNIDDVALMDNIVTVCPVDGGVIIDIIKLNPEDCDVYVNICDVSSGIEELVQPDANMAAISQVKNDYGIDISPFVSEEEEENEEEEETRREKEEEKEKLDEELEEVKDNLEKINALDDDYLEDEEISELKSQLEEKKNSLMEKLKQVKEELGETEEGDDMEMVVEAIYEEMSQLVEDIKSGEDVDGEVYEDEMHDLISCPCGMHNITDTLTVTPVMQFERNKGDVEGNEQIVLADAFLKVDDKSDDDLQAKFEDSKYMVNEDGYISLCIEPVDIMEGEIPEETKDDIKNVMNTVAPTDSEGEAIDVEDVEEDEEGLASKVGKAAKSAVSGAEKAAQKFGF